MLKKVITCSALFLCSTPVLAIDPSSTFQWIGTVPGMVTGTTYEIYNPGGTDHSSGMLIFKNDGTKVEITSSSDLVFNVRDNTTKLDASSFSVELTKLSFSAGGGLLKDVVNDEFILSKDNTPMVVGTPVTAQVGEQKLTIASNAAGITSAKESDQVVLQGVILVSNILP
ncbi:hypothetical protein [Vibrio sp. F13]|uniref:hypothetical protein n=1 Tax=Vibrio sp. F13 TaxID=2070777 RepID=UPI0010BDD7CD|nr:hypothetical protein [Vibrio sp. F13]TKG09032.1 hypothetical protein FCV67_07940 [Vibrio sp. F13]